MSQSHSRSRLFFFNDTATTEIYTLSLHDALPIYHGSDGGGNAVQGQHVGGGHRDVLGERPVQGHADDARVARHQRADRKSTRLNSSHSQISYAVFCLKKKKKHMTHAA